MERHQGPQRVNSSSHCCYARLLRARERDGTEGPPVLKAGATATETELRNYARDHLAHFKCPQRIQFVSELPKTATGKVQKVCPSRQARDFEAVTRLTM
jgi:acyl-CoA synthetase (AMP-forming)/AMP-acid ligase II